MRSVYHDNLQLHIVVNGKYLPCVKNVMVQFFLYIKKHGTYFPIDDEISKFCILFIDNIFLLGNKNIDNTAWQ